LGAIAAVLTVTVAAGLMTLAPGSGSASTDSATTSTLPNLNSRVVALNGPPAVSGVIGAPGGPYLRDASGRVVFFHGVNAVYKHPPFELFPAPRKAWNFSAADASLMARLGFNVVRLGVTWSGLEPGSAPPNDPAICAPGRPSNPHQFNQAVFDRYMNRLRTTVELLGRFHIYTILDMHQDVYNQMFDGEGAPGWAVCTNGLPSVDPPGRWSLEYSTAAADMAYGHFWRNDVRGDLQGQYDNVWGLVARAFRGNPWVLGYDPFNEPYSKSLIRFGDAQFDSRLECFYTGTAHIGALSHGAHSMRCPAQDPADGVLPTILANDPTHLIFDEPDNYASRGFPTYLGPMNLHHLVFNVHVYCGARSPVTGNPTDVGACVRQEVHSLGIRAEDRPEMASRAQPDGPAWFVSEFGATSDPAMLAAVTARMDAEQVGWTYWAWKYYADPTGSADESLVMANGRLRSTAMVLSQVYPQAVAGVPVSFSYSPLSDVFNLAFVPNHRIHAPTVVFVPTELHYPNGYCARATGARVTSPSGSDQLTVENARSGHSVTVSVAPGRCAPGSPAARSA
jgi:endoglycosylceramidase